MHSITLAAHATASGRGAGRRVDPFQLLAKKSYEIAQSFFEKIISCIEATEDPSLLCHKFNSLLIQLKTNKESLLDLFSIALGYSQTLDPESAFTFRKHLSQIEETFDLKFGKRLDLHDNKQIAQLFFLDAKGNPRGYSLSFQLGYTSDFIQTHFKWNRPPARGGAGDGPFEDLAYINMREIVSAEQFAAFLALKTTPPSTPFDNSTLISALTVAGYLSDRSVIKRIYHAFLTHIHRIHAADSLEALGGPEIDESGLDTSKPELLAKQKMIRGTLEFLKNLYPHLQKAGILALISDSLQLMIHKSMAKTLLYTEDWEPYDQILTGPGLPFLIHELQRIRLDIEEATHPITTEELHELVKNVARRSGCDTSSMEVETSALPYQSAKQPIFLNLREDGTYEGMCCDFTTTLHFDGNESEVQLIDPELTLLARVFNQLQTLHIANADLFEGSSLAYLNDSLKQLTLIQCLQFDPIHLSCMGHLKHLEFFMLTELEDLTDEHLVFLAPLTSLKGIALSRCSALTGSGLAYLAPLTELTHIDLSGTDFKDEHLRFFEPFTHLQALNLSACTSFKGTFLFELRTLPIKILDLSDTPIKKEFLSYLSRHPTLETLSLSGCLFLTDEIIPILESIPHLSTLTLSKNSEGENLSLKALEKLLEKPSLEILELLNYQDDAARPAFLDMCKRFQRIHILV